jgi:uncharacterized radical SAM superfamily Fe-S cluster-containing enzyme
MIQDIYCPLYNQGLYVEKINQYQAHVSMCCYQPLSPDPRESIDFFQDRYLQSVRKQYNNGLPPRECSSCWQLEKLNYQSYRQGEIASIDAFSHERYDQPILTNLFYNCENICNLRCVICGPRYSSQWISDYKKLDFPFYGKEVKTRTKHNQLINSVDFSHLRRIHFTGGEPLLSQDHKSILAQAREHGSLEHCVVSYNTNGTQSPDRETLELWKQAKLVKIYFSIDSVGESFNYVRFPADWYQVKDNIKQNFLDIDINLIFGIGPTANISNVFYIGDIIQWMLEDVPCNRQNDPTSFYINPVGNVGKGGELLDLKNLDANTQDYAKHYLEQTQQSFPDYRQQIQAVINTFEAQGHSPSNEWILYLDKLDHIRGTDWRTSLSKLSQHIS